MTLTHLIAFNLTLLAAMAAPGPALLFALRQSISGGFAAGLATGAGLGLAAAMWTAAALLGLNVVFAVFPWAYLALKLVGAVYLLYVAWSLWRDARAPVAHSAHPGARAFRGGLLVNLANPKAVLFAASVLILIFPPGLTALDKAVIIGNHLAVELCVYAAFAALLSTGPARAGYLRAKPKLDRMASLVLGALGLRLLVER